MQILLSILVATWSVAHGYDRCFVTADSSCGGPVEYQLEFPRAIPAENERKCSALPLPCDGAAMAPWVAVYVQEKRALYGGVTRATFRGKLASNPSQNLDPHGKFISVAGKALHLCFQSDGARLPRRLSGGGCPTLARTKKCSHGMNPIAGDCHFAAPVTSFDPTAILATMKSAEEALENARRQSGDKSEVEVDGETRAIRMPGN